MISIQHFGKHEKRQKPSKINGLVPLYYSLSVEDRKYFPFTICCSIMIPKEL